MASNKMWIHQRNLTKVPIGERCLKCFINSNDVPVVLFVLFVSDWKYHHRVDTWAIWLTIRNLLLRSHLRWHLRLWAHYRRKKNILQPHCLSLESCICVSWNKANRWANHRPSIFNQDFGFCLPLHCWQGDALDSFRLFVFRQFSLSHLSSIKFLKIPTFLKKFYSTHDACRRIETWDQYFTGGKSLFGRSATLRRPAHDEGRV